MSRNRLAEGLNYVLLNFTCTTSSACRIVAHCDRSRPRTRNGVRRCMPLWFRALAPR